MEEGDYNKIQVRNNKWIKEFGYKNELVLSIDVSDQKSGESIYLILLIDDVSQCRNGICYSLFQFSNKNSNK